jgi:hypothetical protein
MQNFYYTYVASVKSGNGKHGEGAGNSLTHAGTMNMPRGMASETRLKLLSVHRDVTALGHAEFVV